MAVMFVIVHVYIKSVPEQKLSRLDISKCQDLTAEVCCVSKRAVLCICNEAKMRSGLLRCQPQNTRTNINKPRLPYKCFTQKCFQTNKVNSVLPKFNTALSEK
jgi:hypothetical protein